VVDLNPLLSSFLARKLTRVNSMEYGRRRSNGIFGWADAA
jgi:hypothetical protein